MSDSVRIRRLQYRADNGVSLLDIESCSIAAGSFTAVGGPNGAGKSLLARHIAGLIESDPGSLERCGPVALVMQEPEHQILGATVSDDLSLGLQIAGMEPGGVRERVRAAAAAAGLDDRLDSVPEELSGGERRRLAIAGAMLSERPILVCDEPWSFLDYAAGMEVLRMLLAAKAAGTTVIVMTHDLQWVLHTADRLLLLHGGRIRGDLPLPPAGDDWPALPAGEPAGGAGQAGRNAGSALLPPLSALGPLARQIADTIAQYG